MKVDVLQLENAKFKSKFSWWSLWVDVAVFDYNCTPYLLQMRVSRLNRKNFNSIRITGTYVYRQSTSLSIGDLTSMSKE